jgi:hypothetical protein
MQVLCSKLLPAMLCLGSGTPSVTAQHQAPLLSLRPITALRAHLSFLPSSSLGKNPGPVLRLSDSTELTGGRILTSFRMTVAYTFTPGVSLGIGPSVSKLSLPEGQTRAYEGLAFLRIRF